MSRDAPTIDLERPAPAVETARADERIAVATQLQLTWWRFKKHHLAMISGVVVVLFYLIAIFADFLAYADPHATAAAPDADDFSRSILIPQPAHDDCRHHRQNGADLPPFVNMGG